MTVVFAIYVTVGLTTPVHKDVPGKAGTRWVGGEELEAIKLNEQTGVYGDASRSVPLSSQRAVIVISPSHC